MVLPSKFNEKNEAFTFHLRISNYYSPASGTEVVVIERFINY